MTLPNASRAVLVVLFPLLGACGPAKAKDPLAKIELNVRVYDGDTATSVPTVVVTDAGTSFSNRPVLFTFNNLNTLNKTDSLVTKLEVTRTINGVSTTCVLQDENGAVFSNLNDWAAASTDYTITATGTTTSRTFGPISITVQPANRTITGGATLHDQTEDAITSGGSFFQTRTVDIGSGGYTGPNFNTVLAKGNARLLDFEVVTVGGQLKVISPADIKANHVFPLLANECGYQTTTFADYTGALDPKTAPLTQAEVTALPSPPAAATSLPLVQGAKFVYQTSDGKKGLVRVDVVTPGMPPSVGFNYSAEQ